MIRLIHFMILSTGLMAALALHPVTVRADVAGPRISLDGDWSFVADPTGSLKVQDLGSAQGVRPTSIPSSWQAQFADLRDYAGVAWYWRSFTFDPPGADKVALLHFGAVDYKADVFVNGRAAGSHEGGYLPFDLDVTRLLHPGENQIAVRVVDAGANAGDQSGKGSEVEGIKYAEIPHGKQNWYVQTSGLWQSVELIIRPRMHTGAVHISAAADGNFKIEVPVVNLPPDDQLPKPAFVGAEIRDAANGVVWKESHDLKPGQTLYHFLGRLESAKRWSPASPTLYLLHTWLSSGDSATFRFGFRTFESRQGKFYLNGQPIYLRGALDQDFYPDTIYTPPSLDDLRDEMRKARALGLNMLRCHIKVPDPRYLDAADEAGVLVWYEIPNWDKLTEDAKRRGMTTLEGMIERDWNHPAVVIVSIINESWGANLKEAGDRAWLKQAYQDAKNIVPGWLVVDNSACCDNFHMATDIADFHIYNAIPEHASDFDRFVADQARRPRWLFSSYGDGAPRGDEPLMLSEFGNWGLQRPPAAKPWWFAREFANIPITRPEGIEKRFDDFQYSSLFGNLDALADATQEQQYQALKYEIESLRAQNEMQGYIITEFTDLNWESNGLLDMWRKPKAYADRLAALQQDDLLVARADKRNLEAGEKAHVDVYFSHYGHELLAGTEVAWRIAGTTLSGKLAMPSVVAGSAAKVGSIEFTAPSTASPGKGTLEVSLLSEGKPIRVDTLDLFFYPPKSPDLPPPVSFRDPSGRLRRLANEMRARGYLAPNGKEVFPVLLTSVFDDEVKQALGAGRLVVLLATDRQVLAPGIEIVPRSVDNLDGNWISSFPWIRKGHEPFKLIGFDTLAGFESQAAAAAAVVRGIPPQNFGDVLAGIFYGWVHSNVGTLVQARCGKGKLIICTLSLGTTYASDPYATYLLDAIINYAVSGFSPGWEIPL